MIWKLAERISESCKDLMRYTLGNISFSAYYGACFLVIKAVLCVTDGRKDKYLVSSLQVHASIIVPFFSQSLFIFYSLFFTVNS